MFFAFAVNLNRNQSRAVLGCLIPISFHFLWKSTWNLSRLCAGVTQTNLLPCSIEIQIQINQILFRAAHKFVLFSIETWTTIYQALFWAAPKNNSCIFSRNCNRNQVDSLHGSPRSISLCFQLKLKCKPRRLCSGIPQTNLSSFKSKFE